jgi:hypothetical protein
MGSDSRRKEVHMRPRFVGGLIAVMLSGAACHTMAPLSWDEVAGLRPSVVYVTRADQTVVQVSGPQVFGDTLVGYVNGAFQELATAEVTRVAMRRPARAKTIALLAASTAGATLLAVWISGLGPKPPGDEVDCGLDPDHPDCQ